MTILASSDGSAVAGKEFTRSDVTPCDFVTRAIFVGTGGTVHIRWAGDQTNTVYTNVVSGSTLNVRADRIWSTGTTASGFVIMR